MSTEELAKRIAEIRERIDSLVRSPEDLSNPEVVSLYQELNGLLVLYHEQKGQKVHDSNLTGCETGSCG